MKTLRVEAPAMYGDHHVMEVRRLLQEMEGVSEVYASSGFQTIEATYDEKKVKEEAIIGKLKEEGYLDELPVVAEQNGNKAENNGERFFRKTAVYDQTPKNVGFVQNIAPQERPLWPCPGMGALGAKDNGS